MAGPCQPINKDPQSVAHVTKMNDLMYNLLNPNGRYKNIAKRYSYDKDQILQAVRTYADEYLNVPFAENFYLKEHQWKRLEVEFDAYNKKLEKDFTYHVMGNFGVVPDEISKLDPSARKFHLDINEILGYERTQLAEIGNYQQSIARSMREAYLKSGQSRLSVGSSAIKKIRQLQTKILRTDKNSDRIKFSEELNKIVDGDEGKIIRNFITLTELPTTSYNLARQRNSVEVRIENPITKSFETKYEKVGKDLFDAVDIARKQMDVVGDIAFQSLIKMEQLVDRKFELLRGNKKTSLYINFKKELNAAKERIKKGKEEGGYLPKMLFESLIEVKEKLNKFTGIEQVGEGRKELDILTETLTSIHAKNIPGNLKARNNMLNNTYNKDPLFMIDQYSKEMLSFNKSTTLKKALLDALKTLPEQKDTKFLKGLSKFIYTQFEVANKGLSDRPAFFNNASRIISTATIISSMGLNAPGSVRNLLSVPYYIAEIGVSSIKKSMNDLKDPEVKKALEIAEKEQGYLFPSIARELVSEGLVPTGTDSRRITYDPMKGEVKLDGSPLRDTLEASTNWTIDKMLVFHRKTENLQRSWMFKTAFAYKYKELITKPEFMKEFKGDEYDGPVVDKKAATTYATKYATRMVNMYAYEYSIHSKSKLLRGTNFKVDELGNKTIIGENVFGKNAAKNISGAAGVISQFSTGLLHYPMSLLGTHLNKAKGVRREWQMGKDKEASTLTNLLVNQPKYLAKNIKNSRDVLFFGRYAGMYGMLQLTSIILNSDLNNLFDFDMINRVKDMHKNITSDKDSDEALFGVAQSFTGIGTSKMFYMMQMMGIINTDRSDMERILFGNVDYESDRGKELANYQVATIYGHTMNKYWPMLKSGSGSELYRHLFYQYPSKWTKEGHSLIFNDFLGVKPKRKGKFIKRKKYKIKRTDTSELLKALDLL